MTVKQSSLVNAYEQMLGATTNECSFHDVLNELSAAYGAAGGVIFELNRRTCEILDWVSPNLPFGSDAYSAHLNSINPRMQFSLQHGPGHIAFESMFISDQAIRQHEFYDWLERFGGLQTFLGSRLYDEGDISVFHSLEFSKSHGHADVEQIESFSRTATALGNAWRASKRISTRHTSGLVDSLSSDSSPWAIFALSSTGQVLNMNPSARKTINQRNALELRDGYLFACDTTSHQKLSIALRSGLSGRHAETLVDTPNGPPLLVQLLPIDPGGTSTSTPIAVLAYVWNPSRTQNRRAIFKRIWKFTDAEARLADLLCTGIDLSDAAGQMEISRNTARNHLQNVFAKTQTRKQGELIVQLIGVIEY